jgi:hypothetical protein
MGIISSDDDFNAAITAKSEKKKIKDYQVIPVDFPEAMLFRKTFLETYKSAKEKPKTINSKPSDERKLNEIPKEEHLKKDEQTKKNSEEKDGF